MRNKKLVFCKTAVKKDGILRENREGVEHIVLTSYTLPPNVVMNGSLYPSEEVDKSYKSLERTLAPVEHPQVNGQYISALDPISINNFYAGAWNETAERQEDGRIKVTKVINVQEALKSERGKRLLDRINGIESGEDMRPIHTSVGVWLESERLPEPAVNEHGQEYYAIARNMTFDHDAILLDTTGAATPDQGVGIAVNTKGDEYQIEFVTNEQSFSEIHSKLNDLLNKGLDVSKNWVIDVYSDHFIYETAEGEYFKAEYIVDDSDNVLIQDTRLPVERVTEYKTINPLQTIEDQEMDKEKLIAMLAAIGISVNSDITEAELLAKIESEFKANQGNKDLESTVADQQATIADLKAKLAANEAEKTSEEIKQIQACNKYAALSESALKTLKANSAEDFNAMLEDSKSSVGLGATEPTQEPESNDFAINSDLENLPE